MEQNKEPRNKPHKDAQFIFKSTSINKCFILAQDHIFIDFSLSASEFSFASCSDFQCHLAKLYVSPLSRKTFTHVPA
jgi:hypothetical protein